MNRDFPGKAEITGNAYHLFIDAVYYGYRVLNTDEVFQE